MGKTSLFDDRNGDGGEKLVNIYTCSFRGIMDKYFLKILRIFLDLTLVSSRW